MAFADPDRKRLWGRAGSRCAVCNTELTRVDGMNSIVGDEAHIRSKKEAGPRFDATYPQEEVDSYENRILLCKPHHKLVDDNEDVFSTSLLLEIKSRHEGRVARALDSDESPWKHPLEVIAIQDGTQLMTMAGNAMAFLLGNDHPRTDEERSVIGTFLQDVQDWGEIAEDIGASGRIDGAAGLHAELDDLKRLGFVVLAGLGDYEIRSGFVAPTIYVRVTRITDDDTSFPSVSSEAEERGVGFRRQ